METLDNHFNYTASLRCSEEVASHGSMLGWLEIMINLGSVIYGMMGPVIDFTARPCMLKWPMYHMLNFWTKESMSTWPFLRNSVLCKIPYLGERNKGAKEKIIWLNDSMKNMNWLAL